MEIQCDTKIFIPTLLAIAFSFSCIHVLFGILNIYLGHEYVLGLAHFFNMEREGVLPTAYSSFLLICCAFLLGLIARQKINSAAEFAHHWFGLTIIFVYMAMDEAFEIHELIGQVFQDLYQPTGLFYYAWVIPYGILVVFISALYLKFLLHLPSTSRGRFLLSAGIFFLGTFVMEMLGARHMELVGRIDLTSLIYSTLEEFLEMLGLIVFVNALIIYIREHLQNVVLKFR